MDRFQFLNVPSKPALTDQIAVYDAGTTNLVTGLKKMDGVTALANPFAVSAAGTVDDWGFMPPAEGPYDVKNTTANVSLGSYAVFAGKVYEAVQTAASQAEMEAGTESALRSVSPLRVAQAIAALGSKVVAEFIADGVATSVSFSGLNAIAAGGYSALLIMPSEATTRYLACFFNDDETAANYRCYVGSGAYAYPVIAYRSANCVVQGVMDFFSNNSGASFFSNYGMEAETTATMYLEHFKAICTSQANITKIKIYCSQAKNSISSLSAFPVGTRIVLCKNK